MIDLGMVIPGKTLRIPFSSFDKDDGSVITMTNYAVGDILIYKDGNTTERASTAGFTATTDFDSKTGKHLAIIDLADNTTADFFQAGSEYQIGIDAVTVDGVTTGGWIARFEIGYRSALINTSIATLSSQTSFTLTAGPAEDDALNGMWAIIHDAASAVQLAIVVIEDYTGSTKTVTLAAGATFTVAAKDNISIMGPVPLQATSHKLQSSGRSHVIDAAGLGDANVVKIGPTGSGTAQTALNLTGAVGAAGVGLTAIPWNAAWDAEVQSEVEDGIVAQKLDKLITRTGTSTNTGSTTTLVDSARSEATDYWKGQILIPTSGNNIGIPRWITDFDGVGNTYTVFPAWPNALASGVTYIIVPHYSVWEDRTNKHVASNTTGATFSSIDTNITSLVGRITSTLFTGITSLAQWLGLIAGKQTGNTTARTELRATGAASGTYDETTDSLEANRDGQATTAEMSDAVTAEIAYKKNVSQMVTFHMYSTGTRTLLAGLTVSGQVSKDGGAFAGLNGSPSITGISNGYYKVTVAATDFNADNLIFRFTATGADEQPVHIRTQA